MKHPVAVFAGAVAGTLLMAATAQAQTKVRIGFPVQIHTANVMLLQEYAKRSGVDLDVMVLRGYPNIQLALTTNELDIAVLGFVNIGLMEEKGFKDHRVIAGVFSGAQGLTLRNGVEVRTWKDLEGKKIGVAPNTFADLMFKASAKLGGADLSKIKLISFAPPGGTPVLSAMRDGDIDGFVFWEPNNAEAAVTKVGYYSNLDIGDNPTRHINGAIAVNEKYAAANRRTVTAVVKALVEATDALNADPNRYAEVAQRRTGASPEVVKMSMPRGKLDYKLYQKEAKALMRMIHEAGITSIDTTRAVDRAFDYSYLMEVTGKSKSELGGE
jgi:sulfonate transport system substrate-binding protein